MLNHHHDQAASLRRMMAGPKPRVVSVLSASANASQSRLLNHLAATLQGYGSDVLVVDAANEVSTRKNPMPSLAEVALGQAHISHAIQLSELGIANSHLFASARSAQNTDTYTTRQVNHLFRQLTLKYSIVLVNATLTHQHTLPISALNEGEIMIRLTRNPESIKQAYVLIKQICSQLGRRNFGIIVDNASDVQAALVFRNLSQVARRFMLVDLEFFGAIPADDHLGKAAKLGRSVVDAFPFATISTALKSLAYRLDYRNSFANHATSDHTEFASLI